MNQRCVLVLIFAATAFSQTRDRLIGPLNDQNRVTVRGSRSSRVDGLTDEGPVPAGERIRGLSIRFRPTAQQSAALEQLLNDQQDPASPLYHAWLTPEEYAARFGISGNDLARVSQWLRSEGFQIDAVARSRTWITFSASADTVGRTFRTALHRFRVDGKLRYANTAEAQIPADLAPLVHTLRGLDDLPTEPRARLQPRANGSDGAHALAPGDLATIYNMNPLLQKGFDGTGQKIVVAGKSALKLSDIRSFRDFFGLPKNDPSVILVPGYSDPGFNEEFTEVTSDVELAGAIAPKASIIYVYAPNAYAAADYAIDRNLAPVISFSFGGCEKDAVAVPDVLAATRAMAQQANAQGITWVASSGDTGPAACESQREDYFGVRGIGVNLPVGFPEVTGVGGTMFAEGSGAYWAAGGPGPRPTALSYIPETAWNETGSGMLAASSGGASMFYARPSWQTGPGIPSVNARLVPDLSLAAAWNHDPYIIIVDGETWNWGGTSAATPVFAGVLAILNQYLTSTGAASRAGLGNINPKLYQLAQTTSDVFHDIKTGDGIVPCKIGTPDCTTGRYGYNAGPGWDPVTGLGSLDVNNFVLRWAGISPAPGPGAPVKAAISLSSTPSTVRPNAKGEANCSEERPLYQELNLQELNGASVRLTKLVLDSNDVSTQIDSWFGSLRLAPFGTLRAAICWSAAALSSTKNYEVEGIDVAGQSVRATLQVPFKTAALIPGTLSVSKTQVILNTASGSASGSLNVTLPGDEAWTVSTFPANQKTQWLTVSPKSGRGPAQVKLVASPGGLASGVYTATLTFQSEYMTPQFVNVSVVLLADVSGGATITAAQNAASFKPVFAPGMLATLYGTALAKTTRAAQALPLPLSLDGVSASVNGIPAPLWFVSPGQINLQIPYETAIGGAAVVVNNNGQVGLYAIDVTATAPGIFNSSGAIIPTATATRGGSVSMFVTGDGEMTPMLESGAPPPANTPVAQLPKPRAPVKVTVGGVPAEVTFAGNPWLVGISQVNFNVPANAPLGAQPVVITVGGVSSAGETLTVR